jgi:hypothetical protein
MNFLVVRFLIRIVLASHFQFDHLDVAVQELFEQYLEERGINSSLAIFIPEYAEMKEQKV